MTWLFQAELESDELMLEVTPCPLSEKDKYLTRQHPSTTAYYIAYATLFFSGDNTTGPLTSIDDHSLKTTRQGWFVSSSLV